MKQYHWLCITLSMFFCGQLLAIVEKRIIIVIPSYNNQRWLEANLNSVLYQDYENYCIIYVNDCSTDDTGSSVAAYLAAHDHNHRVELINNATRKGALANLYTVIHRCPDSAIIVTVDGDDQLKHNHVLTVVNNAYHDENVWLTYGQFIQYPRGLIGYCQEIPQYIITHNLYREFTWVTSHVRTFYAGLFKKIAREDLLFEGDFFDVTWDRAFMLPMLEMAAGRIKFISEILYVYNEINPLNDFRVKLARQEYCRDLINKKTKYQPLKALW